MQSKIVKGDESANESGEDGEDMYTDDEETDTVDDLKNRIEKLLILINGRKR